MAATDAPVRTGPILRDLCGRVARVLPVFGRVPDLDGTPRRAIFVDLDGTEHTIVAPVVAADIEASTLWIRGRAHGSGKDAALLVEAMWRGGRAPWAQDPPTEGLVRWLAEGGARGSGVGPKKAEALGVDLGDRLWRGLVFHDISLEGAIGETKAAALRTAVREEGVSRVAALAHLMMHNLSLARARSTYDTLGEGAAGLISDDPYILMNVPGIGFAVSDEIATKRLGLDPFDARRLRAMASAVLLEAAGQGSTSLEWNEFQSGLTRLIGRGVDVDIDVVIREALESGSIEQHDGHAYLPRYLHLETLAAESTVEILSWPPIPAAIPEGHESLIGLNVDQLTGVRNALECPLSVLTGAPGTGKTTVVRSVVAIAKGLGLPVTLSATTGKAKDLLEQVVADPDLRASTIHSILMRARNGGPLPEGLLIVDEMSMSDLGLYSRLVERVAATNGATRLMLLGDRNQLPSVLPGYVLGDLIQSGAVPCCELRTVYRQGARTLLAYNVGRIARGQAPLSHDVRISPAVLDDMRAFFQDDSIEVDDIIRNSYSLEVDGVDQIPDRLLVAIRRWIERGYDPIRDVLVLTPRTSLSAGTKTLNPLLQENLNPNGAPVIVDGREIRDQNGHPLRIGDPVYQTINDAGGRDVYNGMRGTIEQVVDGMVAIQFPDRGLISYRPGQMREVFLAYCGTIHKAQGDQAPVVISILHESEHMIMLKRSLLNVASSRATEHHVHIGTARARSIAVRREDERTTRLAYQIACAHRERLARRANLSASDRVRLLAQLSRPH